MKHPSHDSWICAKFAVCCRVVDESADQDSTDLQKCISCAHELIASKPDELQGASIFAAGINVPPFLFHAICLPHHGQ